MNFYKLLVYNIVDTYKQKQYIHKPVLKNRRLLGCVQSKLLKRLRVQHNQPNRLKKHLINKDNKCKFCPEPEDM